MNIFKSRCSSVQIEVGKVGKQIPQKYVNATCVV